MELIKFAAAFNHIFEAPISSKNVNLALDKIVHYLSKKIGHKLVKIPGTEHFKNSSGYGFGHRYVFDGTLKCIRFNWSHSNDRKTSSIISIDIFSGKTRHPTFRIEVNDISLALILPVLVDIISSPSVGQIKTFAVSPTEALSESVLLEVSRNTFTTESALKDFLDRVKSGQSFSRSEFIQTYHIIHAGLFDAIFNNFKEHFDVNGKRLQRAQDFDTSKLFTLILDEAAVINVTAGARSEEYLKTEQEIELETSEKVSFTDSLEHLEGLVEAVIKGAFNSLFLSGKGGVGKTQTVETVLSKHGLRDGNGYFKVTGSSSPVGLFSLLYKHRNSIIVFDDSDGVMQDTDARNIIKAATDTKKHRKLVWNKKSFSFYDPEHEDAEEYAEDPEKTPKHFEFSGRIIFISNLPLEKLDPDGALRTRAFVINIDPTNDELYDYMEKILHDIKLEEGLTLSKNEREEVLEVVKSSKRISGVSLRKLVRALNLRASGIKNWTQLVHLYA